jgi:outer membrane receptor protein involved in Fe transport
VSLRQFSTQSGEQLLYAADVVREVKTASVQGVFSAQDALDRMLSGTGLVAIRDPKTGAFNISRTDPNASSRPPVKAPATVEPAPAASKASGNADDVLTMTPFTVVTDADTGYGAVNANSITWFNVELYRLPISGDILNDVLMKDMGISNVEDAVLLLSGGSGFESISPDTDAGDTGPHSRVPQASLRLRGLLAATMKRDSLIRLGGTANPGVQGTNFSSNFDIERVEVINGPQALLYGSGGAGGVTNTISKQARFGKRPHGSIQHKIDKYKNYEATVDFGMGTDRIGFRLAGIRQEVGARRENVGGPMEGIYGQLAVKVFDNTLVRLSGEVTEFDRIVQSAHVVNMRNAATDGRHNHRLTYLLATNQIDSSAVGNSGAGTILGGKVDWDNINSYSGLWRSEWTKSDFLLLAAETRWSDWLSTQISGGRNSYRVSNPSVAAPLHAPAPNSATNPFNTWAMTIGGTTPLLEVWRPVDNEAFRFSGLVTKRLFRGRAHTQTNFGYDYHDTKESRTQRAYYRADQNWNVIRTGGGAATLLGRTPLPVMWWPVSDGVPVVDPGFGFYPRQPRITYNGLNYVLEEINPTDPSLITPENPLGVRSLGTSANQQRFRYLEKGAFVVNYTQWLEGRLDTLLGVRFNDSSLDYLSGVADASRFFVQSREFNFNVGANYALRDWLRVYASGSDSYNLPLVLGRDPHGNHQGVSHGVGLEIGLKAENRSRTWSGALAFYQVNSENESAQVPNDILNAINPAGLNGRFGSPSNFVTVERQSRGLQATVTASPTKNWRARASAAWTDGTIGTATRYDQFYNDQFNANSQGQVTYSDGTVVYVNPTFSPTRPVVPAGTPDAVPLTIAMLNNPASPYYANPEPVTGRIAPSSVAATVLEVSDPVHGSILTGQAGVPIGGIQINPGFTPPGYIEATRSGEVTTGYGEFNFNVLNVYTFSEGWARGIRIGQTLKCDWSKRRYYYYADGVVGLDARRKVYLYPDAVTVGVILGYERDFKKVKWSTQLNINNVFDTYKIVIAPNATSAFLNTSVLNAAFDREPRSLVWSNTLSF